MSGSDHEQPRLEGDEPISNGLRALFGRNLRAARVALGLRQQEFADAAGFNQQYVSRVEAGQVNLTLDTMRRLAAAVGQDVPSLLRAPEPEAPG